MFRFWPYSGCGGKNCPLLRFFVNNSKPTFHFLKLSFTYFLAISQNFHVWRLCRVWLKFLAHVSFFVSQFSSIWMALISEPLFRFGWIPPHWKATMLLFSNIMRLTTFHVIYLLTSAVFRRFQERYVMWHHSATFKPIWCFGIPIGHQMIINM